MIKKNKTENDTVEEVKFGHNKNSKFIFFVIILSIGDFY